MGSVLLQLTAAELRNLAEQVRLGRVSLPFTPTSIARFVSSKVALETSAALNALLRPEGCLEALAQFREASTALSSQLQIVTTGSASSAADTRRTDVVIEGLFREAQSTVLISGYNIFDGKAVLAGLCRRMREVPSLQVELYLNLRTEPDQFAREFAAFHWPTDLARPPIYYLPASLLPSGDRDKAVLHSKCVVVDGKKVFLTSANLTEAAQDRNIELGVLFSDGSLARQVEEFFHQMVDEGVLRLMGGV